MTEGKQALEQAYALDREGKEHAARTQYERAFALGIPVSERSRMSTARGKSPVFP